MPIYKARSPLIGMRRYFVDLLTVLSNCCNLWPTTRHLAIHLFDLLMDRYDITVKDLHIISFACLLLASKLAAFKTFFYEQMLFSLYIMCCFFLC